MEFGKEFDIRSEEARRLSGKEGGNVFGKRGRTHFWICV